MFGHLWEMNGSDSSISNIPSSCPQNNMTDICQEVSAPALMFCPTFMQKKLVMHPAKDTLKSVLVVPANQNPVNQNVVSCLF